MGFNAGFLHLKSNHKLFKKIAIIWSCGILISCLIPKHNLLKVSINWLDKIVHFIMFGGFACLWLLSFPSIKTKHIVYIFIISLLFGWIIELLQGQLSFLGRSYDNYDIIADAIGGLIGIVFFLILSFFLNKKNKWKPLY